jgi:hypothetical protein
MESKNRALIAGPGIREGEAFLYALKVNIK